MMLGYVDSFCSLLNLSRVCILKNPISLYWLSLFFIYFSQSVLFLLLLVLFCVFLLLCDFLLRVEPDTTGHGPTL